MKTFKAIRFDSLGRPTGETRTVRAWHYEEAVEVFTKSQPYFVRSELAPLVIFEHSYTVACQAMWIISL